MTVLAVVQIFSVSGGASRQVCGTGWREEGNKRCQSRHRNPRLGEWTKEKLLKEARRQGQT